MDVYFTDCVLTQDPLPPGWETNDLYVGDPEFSMSFGGFQASESCRPELIMAEAGRTKQLSLAPFSVFLDAGSEELVMQIKGSELAAEESYSLEKLLYDDSKSLPAF